MSSGHRIMKLTGPGISEGLLCAGADGFVRYLPPGDRPGVKITFFLGDGDTQYLAQLLAQSSAGEVLVENRRRLCRTGPHSFYPQRYCYAHPWFSNSVLP